MKKQTVNVNEVNKIPDYEPIFRETKNQKDQESKVIMKIFYKRIPTLILSMVLFIIKALPMFILPVITAEVVDLVTSGLPLEEIYKQLITLGVFTAVCLLENIPMHMLKAKVTDKLIRKTTEGIRATVVRKLQRLSITYYKEMENGKLQSKFLKDIDSIEIYIQTIVNVIIPNILTLLVFIGITLYNSPIVLSFFAVVIPVMLILRNVFKKPLKETSRAFRKQTETTAGKLTRMLDMLEVTKSHGLESVEINEIEKEITTLTKKGLKIDKTNAQFGSISWVISQIFTVGCLFFTSILALKGVPGFTAGSIVLYQTMFTNISGYVQSLINVLPQITTGKEAIHSVSEIMNSEDIEQNLGKRDIPKVKGKVDFVNVFYRYPNATDYVIKDFNLNVKQGECIALVGSSGSGKSTIMNMIIGFLKPETGTLLIDGQSINDINLENYRHSLSVVPQNSILFEGTIRENITYGLARYSEEDLLKAAEMANVLDFTKDLPLGLDTNVGEHGGKLSGGQKQRICIARAIIRNPSILIMDEATSALDNVSEFKVQQAINSLIKDRTTFIVAHRLSTIRNADRIVVMDKGEIIEVGTFDELMALKGKFFELKNLSDLSSKVETPIE